MRFEVLKKTTKQIKNHWRLNFHSTIFHNICILIGVEQREIIHHLLIQVFFVRLTIFYD
jgi:hypothetical protein